MPLEELKIKTNLSPKILPGEKILCRCKAHKGIWILPLMILIGCITFVFSYPDTKMDTKVSLCLLAVFFFLIFLFAVLLYNRTQIIMTNTKFIVKRLFRTDVISFEDVAIIKKQDALDRAKQMHRHQLRRHSSEIVIAWFLDIVEVIIIDTNAAEFASVDFIGHLNYKELNEIFQKERECRANNDFNF